MKWEFKTLKHAAKGLFGGKIVAEELDQKMNELGQQGWELVSVFSANALHGSTRDIVAVFKRSR